jgi:hypothetical protein
MCGPPSFLRLKCTPCAATSLQSNVAQADGTSDASVKSASGRDRDVRDGAMSVCAEVWMMDGLVVQSGSPATEFTNRRGKEAYDSREVRRLVKFDA